MDAVQQWTRFEHIIHSSVEHRDPLRDIRIEATFTSPNGSQSKVPAFWNGGQEWRFRFSPDTIGRWTFRICADPAEQGLHNSTGEFQCVPYEGDNPLYAHGRLRLSANRRYLEHADGHPVFWLADTAWSGPLKASAADWYTYLADRRQKGFNAIQFVFTQWLAALSDADGRVAYTGTEQIQIDPEYFRRLDSRVDRINDEGFIAVPVLLWAKGAVGLSPGVTLPDDQLILLARYLRSRYGAHHVAWILAGDGDYEGQHAERWKQIGRAVFGSSSNDIVTMHPAGRRFVWREFADEPWFTLNSYQSGHEGSAAAARWVCDGPPAREWLGLPPLPSIDLEINYEGHAAFSSGDAFDDRSVRRAAYWSALVAPPAGVTYGAHGIWSWELAPAVPLNHNQAGVAPPWFEALHFPGSSHMALLKKFFDSMECWTLQPAAQLLQDQLGNTDPNAHIVAALSTSAEWGVLYTPKGATVRLRREMLPPNAVGCWYDPVFGDWSPPEPLEISNFAMETPDAEDWALWFGVPERAPKV